MHCKLRFISSTGLTMNLIKRAVQYTYRQYNLKRDGTANVSFILRQIRINDKPLGYALGFIIASLGGLNFH